MNYTLPRHCHNIILYINIQFTHGPCPPGLDKIPIISHSLSAYLNTINVQCDNIKQLYSHDLVTETQKLLNKYEYITSHIPNTNFSIGKIGNNIYTYELIEIFNTIKLYETMSSYNQINVMNFVCSQSACNMAFQKQNITIHTTHFTFNNIFKNYVVNIKDEYASKANVLNFEMNDDELTQPNNYVINLITYVTLILIYQATDGICIIKLKDIHTKPIIDIIFILSKLFAEVSIIKPNVSAISTPYKYLIAKKYNYRDGNQLLCTIIDFLTKIESPSECNVQSILSCSPSAYFLKKIEELNILFGQQHLTFFEQVLSRLSHITTSTKIDKNDTCIIKSHVQKCIYWCEKNNVPNNNLSI